MKDRSLGRAVGSSRIPLESRAASRLGNESGRCAPDSGPASWNARVTSLRVQQHLRADREAACATRVGSGPRILVGAYGYAAEAEGLEQPIGMTCGWHRWCRAGARCSPCVGRASPRGRVAQRGVRRRNRRSGAMLAHGSSPAQLAARGPFQDPRAMSGGPARQHGPRPGGTTRGSAPCRNRGVVSPPRAHPRRHVPRRSPPRRGRTETRHAAARSRCCAPASA